MLPCIQNGRASCRSAGGRGYDGSGLSVDSRQIGAFAEVASRAAKSAIWKIVGTTVLLCDDVVDMEAGKWQSRLR